MDSTRCTVSECLPDAGWEQVVNDQPNVVPASLSGKESELKAEVPTDPLDFLFPYSLKQRGWRHSCDWLMHRLCMSLDCYSGWSVNYEQLSGFSNMNSYRETLQESLRNKDYGEDL